MVPTSIGITCVVDFMCPWSFIALRSLDLALRERPEFLDHVHIDRMIPFEFDSPGTYPAEGTDWTEYCNSYGPQKATFLLQEKLPRAFHLGEKVGIKFNMSRRIVHTETVNAALVLVQEGKYDPACRGIGGWPEKLPVFEKDGTKFRALDFSLKVLQEHFENLKDPNKEYTLTPLLLSMGIDASTIDRLYFDSDNKKRNAAWTEKARDLGAPPVPLFIIRCGLSEENICLRFPNQGPTSPAYFMNLFSLCLGNND